MHRLLVTLVFVLAAAGAGCSTYVNPLTGTTIAGGVPASTSRLLGIRLPSNMDFYPEHSRITGQDGMEVLRGDAGPAACASSVINGMAGQGWTPRLGSASDMRACYAYEKDGRLAVITIYPQSPTTMTLLIIYTSSMQSGDMPLPSLGRGYSRGSGAVAAPAEIEPDTDWGDGGGISTAPEAPASSGAPIVGRDI